MIPQPGGEQATILVADDNEMVLRATAAMLNRSGYSVVTAADGEAALKAFQCADHAIQLVISDVVMPGMLGTQLVRCIKRMSPSTAALLMSGTRPIPSLPDTVSIAKPFTREMLVAVVQVLLASCDFAQIEREQFGTKLQRPAK